MATIRSTSVRRRRASDATGITELNTMVNALLKENRTLKRQLAKLQASGATSKPGRRSNPVATGVSRMQRKIERALGSTARSTTRRRSSAASASRSSSRTRVRKPASPETQRRRLEALAKARAARAAKKAEASSAG